MAQKNKELTRTDEREILRNNSHTGCPGVQVKWVNSANSQSRAQSKEQLLMKQKVEFSGRGSKKQNP